MNTVKKTIDIDLYSPTMQTIKAQQGDSNSRFIQFALFNQGEPYIISDNISVKMEGHRGDNSSFIKENCVVENNIITASIDEDILYASGTVEAKIVLYDISDNSILSAVPFRIHVQKNPCDKNKIEKEKKSLIDYLILTFEKFKESFNEHVADFQEKVTSINKDISDEVTRAKAAENNIQSVINTNKPIWDDKYTKTEIDNKFSTLETNIDWKESVETYEDIAKTYPTPQDGWTVNVKDTDYTYRYNGTEWVTISANAIPKATQSVDGLLSKEDKVNYDDANNKKHIHSNQSALDEITSEKILNWDNTANNSVTGVKGDAETSYRSGNVNITPADIGALSLSGGTMTGTINTLIPEGASYQSIFSGDHAIINAIDSKIPSSTSILAKLPSVHGSFIEGTKYHDGRSGYMILYNSKEDTDNNSFKNIKYVVLLDEDGNSSFPGNLFAPVYGGETNTVKSPSSTALSHTIYGGASNTIDILSPTGYYGLPYANSILGGYVNRIKSSTTGYSTQIGLTIIGGLLNTIDTKVATSNVQIANTIVGGENNTIEESQCASIFGGSANTIKRGHSTKKFASTGQKYYRDSNTIVGGCSNAIELSSSLVTYTDYDGLCNTIMGGHGNKISSTIYHSLKGFTIIGGISNNISNYIYDSKYDYATLDGGFISGYGNNLKLAGSHGTIIMAGRGLSVTYGTYDSNSNTTIVLGKYNKEIKSNATTSVASVSQENLLVVGGGSSDTSRKNAMRLTTSGYLYYNTGYGAGADYAEFFEWSDGNPNNEDRCGLFVTFDFENSLNYNTFQELPKIRPAQPGEYILGVISGNPSFVGNGDEEWKKRWLYDEFDRVIMEEVQVPITEMKEVETGEYRTETAYDENDNEIEVQVPVTETKEVETGEYRTELRQVLNPDYDEAQLYISRNERKEWETTGLLGVLSVRDDGTCIPGKFCKCSENGIATIAEERNFDTFLVLRRVTDNVIKIIFK